ncbi:MAG: Ig-like domain-containing protein, partial [Bacteroides sp.]
MQNLYFCNMLHWRNYNQKRLVRSVLGVAMLVATFYSCASIGRPDGGPIDETPPRFIGSSPTAGALNNTKKRVVVEFDEFIKLEKPNEKVVISPPQVQQPEIKPNGKKITI